MFLVIARLLIYVVDWNVSTEYNKVIFLDCLILGVNFICYRPVKFQLVNIIKLTDFNILPNQILLHQTSRSLFYLYATYDCLHVYLSDL